MATTPRVLTVRTREIRSGDPLYDPNLLELLPDSRQVEGDSAAPVQIRDASLSWVCHGEGLVGWGEVARIDTAGPDRFTDTDDQWQRLCTRMEVDDTVRLPGTGPVAFASIAFDDQPGRSALVVPEVVIGQRGGVRWITTIGEAAEPKPVTPVRRPGPVRYSDGRLPATSYRAAVAEAVRRMRGPERISKVVLAHDLLATTSEPLDARFLLHNLAERYPSCWTFAVDGLVGATPELLLERNGDRVQSRVLAGTSWPRDGADDDHLAKELLDSPKNLGEHAYAVKSLAETLRPYCDELSIPERPDVLRLRNVMHLASDVSGRLNEHCARNGRASLLRIVSAVHPTAAVGGAPTADAVRLIDELEDMDRERYAGPVGWVDGDGNGEFGIALRCAQIQPQAPVRRQATGATAAGASGAAEPPRGDSGGGSPEGSTVRLFAGCGIVADSDPDEEVAEAQAKLLPIREALEGVQ
ncbi:isochorismate synthase [Halopolyspora algeriensis]|uniref:Isochorismate synthase n=1 Tax=Halopolyspora algeriensis TaxID=1500506 RepID=A0A368VXE5_9ACTN|nr:chorismate-binding protein [Halopolyspora algeriensis]RCW46876.1 isochorismate synthase [Halopolyspora algeriensis]TQM47967.1 isochorismate synthase [Halopolyspora algeriensis]